MSEQDERFQVKVGKFGSYFFDSKHHVDMGLQDVKEILNFLNKRYVEYDKLLEKYTNLKAQAINLINNLKEVLDK